MSNNQFLVPPTAGATLRVLHDTIRVLASGEQTDGAYEVFEVTGSASDGPPPHHHPWDESFFILAGEVDLCMGEDWVTATPGYFVNVPRGTVHTYRVHSETARFIVLTVEAGAAAFFADMDRTLAEGTCTMETIMAVASRHQVMPGFPT